LGFQELEITAKLSCWDAAEHHSTCLPVSDLGFASSENDCHVGGIMPSLPAHSDPANTQGSFVRFPLDNISGNRLP
jgi:hypothetical protein